MELIVKKKKKKIIFFIWDYKLFISMFPELKHNETHSNCKKTISAFRSKKTNEKKSYFRDKQQYTGEIDELQGLFQLCGYAAISVMLNPILPAQHEGYGWAHT